MINCLIVNPSALSAIYQKLSRQYAAIEPPLWGALIAQYVRTQTGKSVKILDCEALDLTAREGAEEVCRISPDIAVIVVYGQQPSASTQNMAAASALCTAIKQINPKQKILLVGGHCSALPRETLRDTRCDYVAQGEGIEAVHGLLKQEKPEKISGLWYWDDDEIKFSGPSKTIPHAKMDEVYRGFAWDLLPMEKYRAHNWHCFGHVNERQPYASIYTSLGCPFKCTFCCINAPFERNQLRHWSPEVMIREFDTLVNAYAIKNIKIADEMFVLKEKHFLELCRLLKERNYNLNIWAYSRIDTVKPHHLKALKEAGVNWLALGIESKSKFVRDGVDKGRFKDEDIVRVVKEIKDAGINVIGNYIFGLPDDTYESMQETLDLALELNCEMANFYSAMAYPGSQLYTLAKAHNWNLPKTWLGYSQHSYECTPLDTKTLSGAEVLGFRDKAFEIYFNDPEYLKLVKERFGDQTLSHIQEMTKIKLERKNSVDPGEQIKGR